MPKAPNNLYDRHRNRRAVEKKQRAKDKHFEDSAPSRAGGPCDLPSDEASSSGTNREGLLVEASGHSVVVFADGRNFTCDIPLALQSGTPLAVGDRLAFEDGPAGCLVRRLLPSRTVLSRLRGDRQRLSAASKEEHVIAANIDIAVVVAAVVDPEFHPRFVDRYLILSQNGGISPVICLNKCDLTPERHPMLQRYRALGIPVVETSVASGVGIDDLVSHLRGKIAVLVGHSGVGKSSLINRIVPGLDLRTRAVSTKSRRGRHTTTSSHLYAWEPGSFIIDTPGIRSLGVGHIPREELRFGFPEFLSYAGRCHFRDCLHDTEPGCAVQAAVRSGEISPERYDSYLRMLRE
jgi:ribosome biogenesis GTPase